MKLDPLSINPSLLTSKAAAPVATGGMDMKRIEETAREFETMFLSEMLRPIFESIKVDENFGGGKGEEMYRGFMRDEYAKNMSAGGGIGIAELVKEQLIEMQSKADARTMAQNMQGNSAEVIGASDV